MAIHALWARAIVATATAPRVVTVPTQAQVGSIKLDLHIQFVLAHLPNCLCVCVMDDEFEQLGVVRLGRLERTAQNTCVRGHRREHYSGHGVLSCVRVVALLKAPLAS